MGQPHAHVSTTGLAVTLADSVLRVTLNRPDSLNSLNEELLVALTEVFGNARDDKRVKAVRLGGAGRAFSSGGSLSADEIATNEGRDPGELVGAANEAIRAIVALPRPVVAAVHGPAIGGGLSLALASDIVLASETAYFMLSATKLGLMPDCGASVLVSAAVGRIRALRLALLGEKLSAAEAVRWGLVTAVYPDGRFDAEVDKVVGALVAAPAVVLGKTKEAINEAALRELNAALEREKREQSALLASADFAEGVAAFQQRRTPVF
ncbi:MAG TPA: enoyl-CoA hydratase [Mycobacterium sp.]|nr:enoyl-CoA hydratase [Mycobacterium sp.]